jgi:energy-coupling factor transporter transmembrane protein EcfT
VETPASFLHRLDPRVKQAWLLLLLLLPGKLALPAKLGLAAALSLLSVACLPRRVWAPQLSGLVALCGLLFVFGALGTDRRVLVGFVRKCGGGRAQRRSAAPQW